MAAAWGRVLRAPELGRRGDRAGSVPRLSPGGAVGSSGTPPRVGMEGGGWCCWEGRVGVLWFLAALARGQAGQG